MRAPIHFDGAPVAVIEAKKLTVGPQNVLTQAQRYARGIAGATTRFGEYRVPFLYSTNGPAERVDRALAHLTSGRLFTEAQQAWLGRIRDHLTQNLSIDRDDFDTIPLLQRSGGWGAANRAFEGRLAPLLVEINAAIAS